MANKKNIDIFSGTTVKTVQGTEITTSKGLPTGHYQIFISSTNSPPQLSFDKTDTTFQTYDTIATREFTTNEIVMDPDLTSDTNKIFHTGHYIRTLNQQEKDGEVISHWGDYLDNQQNLEQFKINLISFIKNNTSFYDYNYIFTDGENYFYFFAYDITLSRTPLGYVDNMLDGILDTILKIGYVYDKPQVVVKNGKKVMEFPFMLKDGSKKFSMYLIPMDDKCYLIDNIDLEEI